MNECMHELCVYFCVSLTDCVPNHSCFTVMTTDLITLFLKNAVLSCYQLISEHFDENRMTLVLTAAE